MTTLKDLKDAAQKLGFSAAGYQLEIGELEDISNYSILPIGRATGTPKNPLHFILVKKVTKDYAVILNSRTLKPQTISISRLLDSWNGYALVLSIDKKEKPPA